MVKSIYSYKHLFQPPLTMIPLFKNGMKSIKTITKLLIKLI
jgi:hypothetical protein